MPYWKKHLILNRRDEDLAAVLGRSELANALLTSMRLPRSHRKKLAWLPLGFTATVLLIGSSRQDAVQSESDGCDQPAEFSSSPATNPQSWSSFQRA